MSYFSTRVLVTGVSPLVISAKSKVALLCRRRNVTIVGSFPSISPSLNLSVSARVRAPRNFPSSACHKVWEFKTLRHSPGMLGMPCFPLPSTDLSVRKKDWRT